MEKHIVFDCDGTLVDTSQFKYQLYSGIKELLLKLSVDHVLYVWTVRDRLSTLRILKELQVAQLFEGFCTIDDAPPKPYTQGLAELVGDVKKSQVCLVGDTTNDILGARNFGIRSIGAAWNPSANIPLLKEAGADFVAKKPQECLDWIIQNIKVTD